MSGRPPSRQSRVEVIEGREHTLEGADVRISITFERRTDGPMSGSHHWHAEAWIGDEQVENSWCYSREVAFEEALGSLATRGVDADVDA